MNSFIVIDQDDFSSVLRAQSEQTITDGVDPFSHGYLVGDGTSPIATGYQSPENIDPFGIITRGWGGQRPDEDGHRVYYLRRRQQSSEEGFYNCHMPGDTNSPAGLYILYPSE